MQTTHYHNTGMIVVKQLISEEIKAQTEAFLDKGGKIQEIPSTEAIRQTRPVRDFSPLV